MARLRVGLMDGPMQPNVRGALGTMLPFNKVVRRLKTL